MTARGGAIGPLVIRRATEGDRHALAALAGELGYPSEPEEIDRRLAALPDGDEIHVAVAAGRVIGWIHLAERRSLAVEPFAEVAGLVVAAGERGRGIGRALLDVALPFARVRNLCRVVVRSNVIREAAHAFYRGAGYREVKRSAVFERVIE